jgi:hypothetical protein
VLLHVDAQAVVGKGKHYPPVFHLIGNTYERFLPGAAVFEGVTEQVAKMLWM